MELQHRTKNKVYHLLEKSFKQILYQVFEQNYFEHVHKNLWIVIDTLVTNTKQISLQAFL